MLNILKYPIIFGLSFLGVFYKLRNFVNKLEIVMLKRDTKINRQGNEDKNMVAALDVARYILYIGHQNGDCITNLKLQKLLYYAQAWYLVNFEEKLFSDKIEAWQYGPVIKDVYEKFKKFGNKPINEDKFCAKDSKLNKIQKDYLEEFCSEFFKYSATELVSMTHREQPWLEAYEKTNGAVISTAEMQNFYSKI